MLGLRKSAFRLIDGLFVVRDHHINERSIKVRATFVCPHAQLSVLLPEKKHKNYTDDTKNCGSDFPGACLAIVPYAGYSVLLNSVHQIVLSS